MMRILLTTMLLSSIAFPSNAQEAIWKADLVHSKISFSVSHLVIAEASGRFNSFDVALVQKGNDFSGASVDATIQAASIDTDNDRRDTDLRGESFFATDKFPVITFKSTAFDESGEGRYRITGDLTIRDQTHPVMIDALYAGTITDNRGRMRAGFKGTTSVNRFDYNVRWDNKLDTGQLVVGKDVQITLSLEMIKQ